MNSTDYLAELKRVKDRLDLKVAALSPVERSDWYTELADHEYFDGEVEIEDAHFDRWIADRRKGPATCVLCGATYRRTMTVGMNPDGRTVHFHKEGATA